MISHFQPSCGKRPPKNIQFASLSINQSIYLHQTTWIHITIKENTMK